MKLACAYEKLGQYLVLLIALIMISLPARCICTAGGVLNQRDVICRIKQEIVLISPNFISIDKIASPVLGCRRKNQDKCIPCLLHGCLSSQYPTQNFTQSTSQLADLRSITRYFV